MTLSIHQKVMLHALMDKAGGHDDVLAQMKIRITQTFHWERKKSIASQAREVLISLADSWEDDEKMQPPLEEAYPTEQVKGTDDLPYLSLTTRQCLSAFLFIPTSKEIAEWLKMQNRDWSNNNKVIRNTIQGLEAAAIALSTGKKALGFSVGNSGGVTIHKKVPENLTMWTDYSFRVFKADRNCEVKWDSRGYPIHQPLIEQGEYDSEGKHIQEAKVYHSLTGLHAIVSAEDLVALAHRVYHAQMFLGLVDNAQRKQTEAHKREDSRNYWRDDEKVAEYIRDQLKAAQAQLDRALMEMSGADKELSEYDGWFDE